MENAQVPYEPPTIVTYGTVRELTLGTGGTTNADVQPCTTGTFQSTHPSGTTCKAANSSSSATAVPGSASDAALVQDQISASLG